jgi:hypothetical protein
MITVVFSFSHVCSSYQSIPDSITLPLFLVRKNPHRLNVYVFRFSHLLFLSEEDVISFDDAAQRDQNQKMFPKR